MILTKNSNVFKWVIIVASFAIVSLILWNTYVFFQHFKKEERIKMKTWTYAYNEFSKNLFTPNQEINKIAQKIVLDSTVTSPMLLIDSENNIISYRNINGYDLLKDSTQENLDSIYVYKHSTKLIKKFNSENEPLILQGLNLTLHYGNSPLINKLKYYPLALLLIVFLFGAVIFFFYSSNKNAIQNKLWSGMAKETAHQIGTPLSSLIGWTEILKTENVDPDYIIEMEKDIDRLQTITERFSKIGSIPVLEPLNIIEETINSYDYLKSRSSKLVDFKIIIPEGDIIVNLNKQLYSWTIENLVKNAIDAMKGRGKLTVEISQLENNIKVSVSDTGKGILKKDFNRIFDTGYTTKKRGWGLGLSLTKRIIEDFHDGKIKVLQSEIGKGTTIQIALKRAIEHAG
ncbi:sensor histidine kinase [Thalassobellus sediminis]|uniref:sensor histidine kinase n=1 Tax=Thalassobellus sediminis TaxID=3367753 RepID=UPI0037AEF4F5